MSLPHVFDSAQTITFPPQSGFEQPIRTHLGWPSRTDSQPTLWPRGEDSSSSSSSSSSSVSPMLTFISPYTVFIATCLLILVLTRIIHICCFRRNEERENEARWSGVLRGGNLLQNGVNINLPRGGGQVSISLDSKDRIKLYQRTFEQKNLVHTVAAEDFEPTTTSAVTCDNPNDNNDNSNDRDVESQDFCYDDEDAPYLYLNLKNSSKQSKSSNPNSKITDDDDGDNSTQQSSSGEEDNDANANNNDDNNDNSSIYSTPDTKASRTKVAGFCIICFEPFRVGERLVRSEHSDACQHVFHEDCMARYLASNSERTKPVDANATSYSDNPCPTCRHPFCTVAQNDIILSVLLKSMRVAIMQTREQHPNLPANGIIDMGDALSDTGESNNHDDDDDSDSSITIAVAVQSDIENPNLHRSNPIPEESTQDFGIGAVTLQISSAAQDYREEETGVPRESIDMEAGQSTA